MGQIIIEVRNINDKRYLETPYDAAKSVFCMECLKALTELSNLETSE